MWYSAVGCIVTLALSFLAAPLEADAQPSAKVATIGYLSMAGGAPEGAPLAESFRQGLQELGYVEGKTIAIVYRSAEGKPERLRALAAELVQLPVDVIFAQSGQVAEAAKDTTTTIPIVMVSGADPVAIGLVASLARPGGNITGLSLMSAELAGKRLQLLKEASGSLGRVAVLWNARDAVMTNIFSDHGCVDQQVCATGPGFCGAAPAADNVPKHRRRGRGRADELCTELDGFVPARGLLRGPHPERRQARGPAGGAADEVRAGRQPEDRQGPWHYHPPDPPDARGQGDRISGQRGVVRCGNGIKENS